MSATQTGTSDKTYNLISLLYHCLEAAEVYAKYIEDAQEAGDQDLEQLFREAHQEQRRLADRAKQLLGDRITGERQDDDLIDEASIESFPASDSPAY